MSLLAAAYCFCHLTIMLSNSFAISAPNINYWLRDCLILVISCWMLLNIVEYWLLSIILCNILTIFSITMSNKSVIGCHILYHIGHLPLNRRLLCHSRYQPISSIKHELKKIYLNVRTWKSAFDVAARRMKLPFRREKCSRWRDYSAPFCQ